METSRLVPFMPFAALWKGLKCPQRLRAWLAGSPHVNERVASLLDLDRAAEEILAAGAGDAEHEDPGSAEFRHIDYWFSRQQDIEVQDLAARLFDFCPNVDADTIFDQQGLTLRELGFHSSVSGQGHLKTQLSEASWENVLSTRHGIRNALVTHEKLVARADFLFRYSENSWMLVLCRASPRVKDSLIAEAEFIRWVFALEGVVIDQLWSIHPQSRQRHSDDKVEPQGFFRLETLNAAVKHVQHPVSREINWMLSAALAGQPCEGSCSYCHPTQRQKNPYSPSVLVKAGKAQRLLRDAGVVDLRDSETLKEEILRQLTPQQRIQVETSRSGIPHVNREAIASFLGAMQFPLVFLDFECSSEAVPPAAGVAPWEHIPFMYSLHVLEKPDAKEMPFSHFSDPRAPRGEAMDALAVSLDSHLSRFPGSVVVYGAGFESTSISRLLRRARDESLVARLQEARARIVDLQVPFARFDYYHPEQAGKISLKRLLPLLSEVDHSQTDLDDGGQVHLLWHCMANAPSLPDFVQARFPVAEYAAYLEKIRAYCEIDTLGLVKLYQHLAALTGRP